MPDYHLPSLVKAFLLSSLIALILFISILFLPADDNVASEAPNLLPNPGFEQGDHGYYLFTADDSKAANCRFTVDSQAFHGGTQSALLQADNFARTAVGEDAPVPVTAGSRYRVGVWVKAGADLQLQPDTPGVLMRLNLSQGGIASPAGLIFIYADGTVSEGIFPATTSAKLSQDWTHIEAVLDIPANVDAISPTLFLWKGKGSIRVDDFSLQTVDPSTPLSPIVPGATSASAPAGAPGTATAAKLTVMPDHENGIYNAGETVTWTVDVVGDRSALNAMPYSVKADGQVEVAKGTIDLSAGPATITASRANPGVLVAQIFPAGKTTGTPLALGGAAISPDKINLSTPVPADFDAFWQGKIKELDAVPMNPQVEPGDISGLKFSETLDYYKVTLDNVHGTHVYGQLARPKVGQKFPAMLMLQFAGVYPLDKNQVIAQAKLGWLVLDISAHDEPIDGTTDFYNKLKTTTLQDYVFLGAEDRETSYFLRMFLGCVRAVEYLTTRPDWDGRILLVTGGSQGGFQSFATAALCKQVTDVAVDVPAGCDMTGPVATPPRAFGWPYWLSNWGPKGRDLKKTAITAGYYDGINFAARIHCPALVAVGLIDDTARPTGVIAAYNAIQGPKQLLIMPLSNHHGDGNAQGAYYQTFAAWRASLRDGKPAPVMASK